jgi:hypothetical protein
MQCNAKKNARIKEALLCPEILLVLMTKKQVETQQLVLMITVFRRQSGEANSANSEGCLYKE